MAATIKGLGIVWAVDGITFTAGIVTSSNGAQTQSLTAVRSADKVEIKNDIGEVVGEVYTNGKKELTIKVVPSGTTLAAAVTSLDAYLIAPGTKITVADADGTVWDGDYNLDEATMDADNGSPRTATIKMHKFDANDVTTTVAAS